MQTWKRTLATSAARLGHSIDPAAKTPGPAVLRCAQVLHESNKDSFEGQEIRVNGFIRSVRIQKRSAFAEISDGSTIKPLQTYLNPSQAANLATGTAVEISGTWGRCPAGKEQTHELRATDVNVVGEVDPTTYPIQKKYHTPEFLRHIPHLRFRTPFNSLLSRFRSECMHQLGQVFRSHPSGAFTQVLPPLITSSDCEGAGETFTVIPREGVEASTKGDHFFRSPKYLTVSSQLHLEAYAAELGSVWALTPTFRAEKSQTPRHLSEFYMLEAEMNFTHDLEAVLDSVEHIIRDLTRRLYDTPVAQELLTAKRSGQSGQEDTEGTEVGVPLQQRWEDLMNGPRWHRITYTDAIDALQEAVEKNGATFEHPISWDSGPQLEHEKYIVDVICKGNPVFVTDYPKALKPFYMAPSKSTSTHGDTVACFDLLLPEVSEIVGGSLRENGLPELLQNMREHGLIKQRQSPDSAEKEETELYPHLLPHEDLGHLRWYADLRRWGTAPHGGFGLGFDRLLGYLSGVSSIRDVVAFPRYFGRADC